MQTSTAKSHPSASAHKSSAPQSKLLEIERGFEAPVEELFAAFTKASALKSWWWPKDLYADRVDYDFRVGGKYFINMQGADQGGGGMTGEFLEIVPNQRIVMTDQFADADGRPISAAEAKMPGTWPELVYITFEFEAIDEYSTRFTLSQEGIPNEVQKDCIQGWSESFDKLEQYLSDRRH